MSAYKTFLLCIIFAMIPTNGGASPDRQDFDCCAQDGELNNKARLIGCYGEIITDTNGEGLQINLGFEISTQFKLSKTYFYYRIPSDVQYNQIMVPPRQADLRQWIKIDYHEQLEYFLSLMSEKGNSYTIYSMEQPCLINSSLLAVRQSDTSKGKMTWFTGGLVTITAAILAALGGAGGGGGGGGSSPPTDDDPAVISTTPSNNSYAISENLQAVTIYFSHQMDEGFGVILVDAAEWQIPSNAVLEWSDSFRTLSIYRQDDTSLESGSIITFTLDGFKTADGVTMSQYSFSFQIN